MPGTWKPLNCLAKRVVLPQNLKRIFVGRRRVAKPTFGKSNLPFRVVLSRSLIERVCRGDVRQRVFLDPHAAGDSYYHDSPKSGSRVQSWLGMSLYIECTH